MNFRRSYNRINKLLERIYGDINPIMRHASSVADNINYITTSIRTDVQQINATIAGANERLQQAVQMTERRLSDFNALLKVVQEEAEQMFVSTASENCAQIESFHLELAEARTRNHAWKGVPAGAVKVNSK